MANPTAPAIQTVSTAVDKAKLAAAALLVVGGVVAFYALGQQDLWLRVVALLVLLVLALAAFFTSEPGKQLVAYGKDSAREVRKVVWPTRKEALQMTGYVFAFVVVMALFLWVTDKTLESFAPAANKRWYVVHAYSGMEKAVERNLRERIDRSEMKEKFGRILVPMEEVVELKNGKRSVSERRFFPGYVLVEMEMGDDSWHLVKHTAKVTGFVGGAKTRPSPISEAEVLKIVSQMQEGVEKPRPKVQWEVGELVRIKEGPFTDFNGSVEDVNYDKSKVRVAVTIFGRATPVELDFAQVEKV
jgi:transcriptional antiterminator NusG